MIPAGTRPLDTGASAVPSLGYRILAGGARLVPLLVVLVGLPVAALTFLQSHGISLPVSILTVEVAGIVISVLSTLRYILRPTRLYGPLSVATSAVTIGYLLVLLAQATYRITIPNSSAVVAIGYTRLLELALIVPLLALAAGLVTTVEDLRAPRERLPYDYPP
ncbi:MAG: hypothetical protein ABSB97_07205 [Thermoplasmata archaeon]